MSGASPHFRDVRADQGLVAARLKSMLATGALVVASCASDSTTATPTASSTTSTGDSVVAPTADEAAAESTGGGADTVGSSTDQAGEDVVRFVAALDEALVETGYAGAVLESPEVFVATARLFCERLEAGATPDEILGDYLETLAGTTVDDAGDDEIVLAGSLLGVGVGTLCREHISLVEEAG